MDTLQSKYSFFSRFSVMIKLMVIGFLGLALLIPTVLIQEIIHERQRYSEEVVQEIHDQWAHMQNLIGPILSIPVSPTVSEQSAGAALVPKHQHVMPRLLQVSGNVEPSTLTRGIYSAAVYTSEWELSGILRWPEQWDPERSPLDNMPVFLSVGISDLRGIENPIDIRIAGETYEAEPGTKVTDLAANGFHIKIKPSSFGAGEEIPFTISFKLRGSQGINILPVGTETEVEIRSTWKDPKFSGTFLPSHREVTDSGFDATWKIAELNRNLPKTWISGDLNYVPLDAMFGVEFLTPIDHYRKAIRSTKYAILTIALTFLVLFLVETVGRQPIHPIQYGMVGFAICLFYILLVSITEHLPFNMAYLISATIVTLTVAIYSLTLFHKRFLMIVLGLVLSVSFGFIFLTLQSQDYALLIGSIGLLIALILTMVLTRNINWYAVSERE